MQYGYFDLEHKEYVITRPDTPAPWANYLGSPEYGAIVSNNGGGYSFVSVTVSTQISVSLADISISEITTPRIIGHAHGSL